jgi:hypothetical protein
VRCANFKNEYALMPITITILDLQSIIMKVLTKGIKLTIFFEVDSKIKTNVVKL